MKNLAQLVLDRAERRPGAAFGMAGTGFTLGEATERAAGSVGALAAAGVGAGSRVAVVGATSNSFLTGWLGLVLAGAEPALINPAYPADLIAEMLARLVPDAVLWIGLDPAPAAASAAVHLDGARLDQGVLLASGGRSVSGPVPDPLPGLGRDRLDVAGYMHTSGTTGVPKFCEQTHEYYLRLGRFIADSMCLSDADTVLAPLPMFHINPLGYGVVGGLTGGSGVLGMEGFSARRFWPAVKGCGATVLILHAPPVEILKRATTAADAAGHRVTRMFLRRPGVPGDLLGPLGVLGLRLHRGRGAVPHLGLAAGRPLRFEPPARGRGPLRRPVPPRCGVEGRRRGGDRRAGWPPPACCSTAIGGAEAGATLRPRRLVRHRATWADRRGPGTWCSLSAEPSRSGSRASSCPSATSSSA